ncbi:MAG: class I SAM-dependent methyltransferase [Proteobacteria bacterium]|nr:class I SAM-dependent methyltransferase [Pseudomonadota bacterium]
MIFIGSGDFRKVGEEFCRYFFELGGLKPNERVLEVGCGIGRMAVALTGYLQERGSYAGFDIVAEGIKWCGEKITPRYPNFRFQLADIYNKNYNPQGKIKASEYKFPYPDKSFDFIILTSVFTHMLPQDMENYFSELARVLAKGGRSLVTFFLLNNESKKLIDEKMSARDFKNHGEGYRTENTNTPESAIAYEESIVKGLLEKYGLNLVIPIHYGSWCGRKNFLSYQDIIIARKN